jgi:hypothetical protein
MKSLKESYILIAALNCAALEDRSGSESVEAIVTSWFRLAAEARTVPVVNVVVRVTDQPSLRAFRSVRGENKTLPLCCQDQGRLERIQ